MRLLVRWLVGAVSLWIAVWASKQLGIPGLSIADAPSALVSVAVLSVVNQLAGPVLGFLMWPLNCLTLGLARVLVGAALFWAVGRLELGLRVDGFLPALFGSIALSVVSALLDQLVPFGRKRKR